MKPGSNTAAGSGAILFEKRASSRTGRTSAILIEIASWKNGIHWWIACYWLLLKTMTNSTLTCRPRASASASS